METTAILEAILFVAEEPLTTEELAQILEISRDTVTKELGSLAQRLAERQSGLVLRQLGGGWRLYTHPEARPYAQRFASSPAGSRLSPAALETLAVVAYR
ncbi:MAG: SMC-Scp complex subunit ScpB, partial [Acidimicrobiia bacterium]